MAAVLTNLYLEPGQRKFLEKQAKTNGTNLSSEAFSGSGVVGVDDSVSSFSRDI